MLPASSISSRCGQRRLPAWLSGYVPPICGTQHSASNVVAVSDCDIPNSGNECKRPNSQLVDSYSMASCMHSIMHVPIYVMEMLLTSDLFPLWALCFRLSSLLGPPQFSYISAIDLEELRCHSYFAFLVLDTLTYGSSGI